MVAFKLNGKDVRVDVADDVPLLTTLVQDLQMNGAKFGCEIGRAHV